MGSFRSNKPIIVVLSLIVVALAATGLWTVQQALRPVEARQNPTVVEVSPSPSTPASRATTLEIVFDQKMDHATVEQSLNISPSFPYDIEWASEGGGDRLIIKPRQSLEWETTYRATISPEARNTAGRPLGETAVVEFTTGSEVRVQEVFPAPSSEEIGVAQPITVRFDRPLVEIDSLDGQDGLPQPLVINPPVDGMGRWLASDLYGFYPEEGLTAGTEYHVMLSPIVAPAMELPEPFEWEFITEGPRLEASFPFNGASEVERAATITLLFSQPMDRESVEDNFQLSTGGEAAGVAGSFQWEDNQTLIFVPEEPLELATEYEVEVSEGARAAGGVQGLASPYRATFATVDFLAVESVQPAPGSAEVTIAPTDTLIVVQFNHPVVSLVGISDEDSLPNPISIEPPLEGTGEWLTTSLFTFRPDGPFAPSTEYVVTVDSSLQDTVGSYLNEPYAWTFTTEFPRVVRVEPSNPRRHVSPDGPIALRFNQPMQQESAEAAFSLLGPGGEPVTGRFEWDDDGALMRFFPSESLARESEYQLILSGGARGEQGGETVEAFEASVVAAPEPRVVSSEPAPGEENVEVYRTLNFTFNTPIDPSNIADFVTLTPTATQVYTYYDAELLTLHVNVAGGLKPSEEYTIVLEDGIRDEAGQPLAEPYELSFSTGPLESMIGLVTPNGSRFGTYSPYTPTLQVVSHRNISRMDFSLHEMSQADLLRFISPDSWEAWEQYAPGSESLIEEWSVDIDADPNRNYLYRTLLPPEGESLESGVYFLRVTAPERRPWDGRPFESRQIVIMTPYNLTIKRSPAEVLVWATDMQSGEPVSGLELQLMAATGDEFGSGVTDDDGLFRMELPDDEALSDPYRPVIALSYDDNGMVSGIASTEWNIGIEPGQWGIGQQAQPTNLYGSVYSDRPIYRPGQTVYYRGVLRQRDGSALAIPQLEEVILRIESPEGEAIDEHPVTLSSFGTFHGEFTLDEEAPTGLYRLIVSQEEIGQCYPDYCFWESIEGAIQVAEYERPEFEVSVALDQSAVVEGEESAASIAASYYFGGGLTEAPYTWRIYQTPYRFEAPALSGYWSWQDQDEPLFRRQPPSAAPAVIREGQGTLDEQGRATIPIDTSLERGEEDEGSQRLTIEAEVSDVNQRTISGRGELIVHAGEYYIGLSPESFIGNANQDYAVQVATVDTGGALMGDRDLTIEFYQREWYSVREQSDSGQFAWTTAFTDTLIATRPVTTDSEGRATTSFTPEQGGSYTALARGEDSQGNEVRSRLYFWVADSTFIAWQRENNDRLELVPDKTSYQVGDIARILVPTPFEGMHALITHEGLDLQEVSVRQLDGTAEVLEIPITEEMIPNIALGVVAVKGITDETPLPEFRVGYVNINVATDEKELNVEIIPSTEGPLEPGTEATFRVRVTDNEGQPVAAEMSVAIVNKAILALGGAEQTTLLDAFYRTRPVAVLTGSSFIVNVDRLSQRLAPEAKGGGGAGGGRFGAELVRDEFLDTAYWRADIITDANGEADVTLTLPDNLTTWTLTTQGLTENTLVGRQTEDLVTTLPLFVRPSLPRFFVIGDEADLRVAVHNTGGAAIEADVSFEAEGLTLRDGSSARESVTVPAGGQTLVSFPVTVEDVESATITIRAAGGGLSDGVEVVLPVYHLTAAETVATSGLVREGEGAAVESIQLPEGTEPTQGELTLELAPSLAGATESTLRWIENYPFESSEAVVSRLVPNVASLRALETMGLTRPELEERLRTQVTDGVQQLIAYQNTDGGWGWWRGDASQAWLTAYTTLGLHEATGAGFTVPEERLARATRYLERWLSRTSELQDDSTLDTRAFILYVLSEAGAGDVSRSVELFDRHALLGTDGRAFLLMALANAGDEQQPRVQTLASELTARAILSATGAHWEEETLDLSALDSSLRSTALVLRALVRVQPEHALLPQTVRWLMLARQNGHWQTTQESAWSVLALTDYMIASGELEADFNYEVALNDEVVLSEQATRENLADPVTLRLDMASLLLDEANRLIITRVPPSGGQSGAGRLYYSAWLRYYLPVESLRARTEGISVARRYGAVDKRSLQGTGAAVDSVEVGDLVQVRLTVNAPNDLYYFTLEDPIPAGFEVVDPALLTTALGTAPPDQVRDQEERSPFHYTSWSQSVIRDEKVVLFSDLLTRGTYEYTYLLRATVPGSFSVLPAIAYQHYQPEVFGRSEGSRFTVTVPE